MSEFGTAFCGEIYDGSEDDFFHLERNDEGFSVSRMMDTQR